MKEKRDAQQAYKSAMQKMKMPALLDTEQHMISSGSGGIKMKSKALAFAAAAAVLALFIGVGAFMLSRNADDTIKIGSSKDMTLETDDTIPSGEITSVAQAVSEHQKCELLENDEYIKLKAGKDNITKQMADSFFERTGKISERNEKCLNYISDNSEDKTLFVHAVKYDNGYIDLKFHLDSASWEKFDELYEKGYSYYICKADTGEKLLRCVTKYSESPKDIMVSTDTSQSAADLEKLTGKLSYVMIGSDEYNEKEIVLKEFEFFDKTFISGTERSELDSLAEKARSGKDEKKESYPIDLKLMDMRADAHGIVVKLTAKPNGEQGAELIRKYGKVNEYNQCDIYPGGESKDTPNEITVVGSDGYCYSFADQHHFVKSVSTEKGEEYIDYICYIPLRKTPPENTAFDIYLKTTSPFITDEDIENGTTKRTNVGRITVNYKRNADESVYTSANGKKIYLSDLYFTVPDCCKNGSLTLKKSDGTQKTITNSDLWLWEFRKDKEDKDLFNQYINITVTDDDIRANFFKDAISTGDVTSITYAGEEYKLADNSEYKSVGEAEQALGEAYLKQLDILQKYKSEKSTLTAESVKQMCEEFDACLDTIGRAGEWLSHQQLVSVLARRTTANELILYLWSSDDFRFVGGSTVKSDCDISADGQVIARGKLNLDLMTPPDDAGYERYMVLTLDCTGSDLSSMNTNQQYSIAFFDNAGGVKNVNFGLASDIAEMPLTERMNLHNEMTQSVGYKAFTSQK